jgi:cytochrome c biogenesis protein
MITVLASNRFTLFALLLLAAGIVVYYQVVLTGRLWFIAVPTLLLVINFLCALTMRNILKNNWPLMVFHFALIVLVALVFLGQLSFFQGTLELAENEVFSGDPRQFDNVRQGPWHQYTLGEARFSNLGFSINYHSGVRRDRTINRIALGTEGSERRTIEIGDHVPLVIDHYRFYTSHNKGFAPVFEWRQSGSNKTVIGSIHLPAYPINEYRQALEWQIPGSDQRLWTQLKIDENVLPEDRPFEFRIPQQHRVVVRVGEQRFEMSPGDRIGVAGGVLQYRELSTWMGYKVDYDWTRPWLLATAIIGLLALFVHYLLKFAPPGSVSARKVLLPRAGIRA